MNATIKKKLNPEYIRSVTLRNTYLSLVAYLITTSCLYLGKYLHVVSVTYQQAFRVAFFSFLTVFIFIAIVKLKKKWTPYESQIIGILQLINCMVIQYYWAFLMSEIRVICLVASINAMVFFFTVGNWITSLINVAVIIGAYISLAYYNISYKGLGGGYAFDIIFSFVFFFTALCLIVISQNHKNQRIKLKKARNESEKNRETLEVTKNRLTKTFKDIRELVEEVAVLTHQVTEESISITTSNESLAKGALVQEKARKEIADNMVNISRQTSINSDNAIKVNGLIKNAQKLSDKSVFQMSEMNTAIEIIIESGKSISKIITTIDEIAFQTNLLALNAAIEASKAGKYGKGFAVVAQEVRELASKSAYAANQTEELIKQLIFKVEASTHVSEKSVSALNDINEKITYVSDYIINIVQSGQKQNQEVIDVNKSMDSISDITKGNALHAEQTSFNAKKLSETSKKIQNLIYNYTNFQRKTVPRIKKTEDKNDRIKRIKRIALKNNILAFIIGTIPLLFTYVGRYYGLTSCPYYKLNNFSFIFISTLAFLVLLVYFKKVITFRFSQWIFLAHLINAIMISAYWITLLDSMRILIMFNSITVYIFLFSVGNLFVSIVFTSLFLIVYLSMSYYCINYLGQSGTFVQEFFYCYVYFFCVAFLLGMSHKFYKQRNQMKLAKKESENIQENLQTGNVELTEVYSHIKMLVKEITALFRKITEEASSISGYSKKLAKGADMQADSINRVSDAMNRINDQTSNNTKSAIKVDELVKQAKESSSRGLAQMNGMNKAIENIIVSGKSISKIIETIDSIAFQTNLLALNASVEAARAHKYGKGFANVANEIRNLSSKSAEAVSMTADLIKDSLIKVETGSTLSKGSLLELEEINEKISTIDKLTQVIVSSSTEQKSAISNTNKTMISISEITKNNSVNTKQTYDTVEKLSTMVERIRQLLHSFEYS